MKRLAVLIVAAALGVGAAYLLSGDGRPPRPSRGDETEPREFEPTPAPPGPAETRPSKPAPTVQLAPAIADPAAAARHASALAANEEGVKLAEKGELEASLARFAEALSTDPDEPVIRANAAKVHAAIGNRHMGDRKFPDAEVEFRTAAELVPLELEYGHLQGLALAQGGGDAEAVPVFQRVLEKKPDRVPTLVALGTSLYRLGRNGEAIAIWEKALALSPDDKELAAELAKAKKEESVEGELMEDLGAPHFTIKFDGNGDPRVGRLVGGVLEDAYRDVGYDLGRYPPGVIAVVVYPKKAFRAVTGSHGWVAALYDGKIRVPAEGLEAVQATEVKRVLTHEYTHALIRSIAGGAVPAWLHEGIAQLEEGRTRMDARTTLRGKTLPVLDDLTGTFLGDSDAGRVRVRYAAAFDFIASLAERRGRTSIAELLDRLGKSEKLDDAVKAIYGVDTASLYEEWRGTTGR
jgi:tetratricopeptide (TPR) repeat protein